jgi:Domain of unknown function (DUF4262)
MSDKGNREQAIDQIRENIVRKGFHTYVVSGGGDPHYAYTIGLTERLGAELILAGSYFYKLDEMPQIIASVVDRMSSSNSLDGGTISLAPWGTFSLRAVDESWIKLLMLGALDFYQSKAIRAFQLVPDDSHATLDVPQMNRPWNPEREPAWRWLQQRWPYAIPSESMAITNLAALRGERTTEVMRWEADEWEIFAGAGPDVPQEERRVVPLSVLLATDETLRPAVDLAVGAGLWRDAESPWHPWGSPSNS